MSLERILVKLRRFSGLLFFLFEWKDRKSVKSVKRHIVLGFTRTPDAFSKVFRREDFEPGIQRVNHSFIRVRISLPRRCEVRISYMTF